MYGVFMKLSKKHFNFVLTLLGLTGLGIAFQNFSFSQASAPACSQSIMAEILQNPTADKPNIEVNCSVTLRASDVVKKQILISGAAASNVVFDCGGGTLAGSEFAFSNLLVRSLKTKSAGVIVWSRPENIIVRNCKVLGGIRTAGMGKNGEGPDLRDSSRLDAKHTARAQQNAPTNIVFENLDITINNNIAIYLGPGTTKSRIINSKISGSSLSAVIYLDAESAQNHISSNVIYAGSAGREVIAVDGSANNVISSNKFMSIDNGGIFIYRNCGEGGTIRHQKPSNNIIQKNIFYSQNYEAINVGSRKGSSIYCSFDAGYPYGSSADDADHAESTLIADNKFIVNGSADNFFSRYIISSSEASTEIKNNEVAVLSRRNYSFEQRVLGRFKNGGGNILSEPAKKSKHANTIVFGCRAANDNEGCEKTVSCPKNKKIVSAKAACNLEAGLVSKTTLEQIDDNTLRVVKSSNKVESGTCRLGDLAISEKSRTSPNSYSASLTFGCREKDKNGGDCHIKGEIQCL